LWFSTGNKSEAYRQAYDAENMSPATIRVKASELSKNGNIAVMYSELMSAAQERNDTTVDRLDQMAKRAYEVAEETKTPAAMNQAVSVLAKLHGLNQPEKVNTSLNADLTVAGDILHRRRKIKENEKLDSGKDH
jgi:hypothetical protein